MDHRQPRGRNSPSRRRANPCTGGTARRRNIRPRPTTAAPAHQQRQNTRALPRHSAPARRVEPGIRLRCAGTDAQRPASTPRDRMCNRPTRPAGTDAADPASIALSDTQNSDGSVHPSGITRSPCRLTPLRIAPVPQGPRLASDIPHGANDSPQTRSSTRGFTSQPPGQATVSDSPALAGSWAASKHRSSKRK
jgi:hypothetical protein